MRESSSSAGITPYGCNELASTYGDRPICSMYDDASRMGCSEASNQLYRADKVDGEEIIRIIPAREANQRVRRIYLQQAAE